MSIQENIDHRSKLRSNLIAQKKDPEYPLLMISESIDDYIEHRIETDRVLEGILKDIQGNVASIAAVDIEKLLTASMN